MREAGRINGDWLFTASPSARPQRNLQEGGESWKEAAFHVGITHRAVGKLEGFASVQKEKKCIGLFKYVGPTSGLGTFGEAVGECWGRYHKCLLCPWTLPWAYSLDARHRQRSDAGLGVTSEALRMFWWDIWEILEYLIGMIYIHSVLLWHKCFVLSYPLVLHF